VTIYQITRAKFRGQVLRISVAATVSGNRHPAVGLQGAFDRSRDLSFNSRSSLSWCRALQGGQRAVETANDKVVVGRLFRPRSVLSALQDFKNSMNELFFRGKSSDGL